MVKAMTDIGDGVARIDYPTIDGKLTSAQYYYVYDYLCTLCTVSLHG